MSVANIPAGTKAAIIRAVVAEKHPKLAVAAIASRFGITYQDLKVVIDKAGYPDAPKMRQAAADFELEEAAEDQAPDDDARDERPDGFVVFEKPNPDGPVEGRLSKVRLKDLNVDPDNVRDLPKVTDADIEELADSMAEASLLQPIVARRDAAGKLFIVMGHRRYIAAKRLKWTTIDTIIRGAMATDAVLAAMLIENGQRKDLDPIEEARGLRRLKAETDCSDLELARRVGRSQPHVSGRLALLSLSAEDQADIRRGDMTLIEGTAKGRLNSGKVSEKGIGRNWHLGPDHDLATKAKARCVRLGHKRGRTVGGMACGECWESVIRADERDHLHEVNARMGECFVCGAPVETKSLEGASA